MVRKRVTTRIFCAAAIRSCTRISLLTAAAISGVSPGARAAMPLGVASSESSQSRSSPTVKRAHRRKGLGVVRVDDQPRDFVGFIGHDLLVEKMRERQVGQRKLRGYALLGRVRGDAGEHVSAAQGSGFGQQIAQIGEGVADCVRWCGRRSCGFEDKRI